MTSRDHGSGWLRLLRRGILVAGSLALGVACGSGGGGGSSELVGQEVEKPGGEGTFFRDPNKGGRATRLHLSEMFWARLVDVHDVDSLGRTDPLPVFRDFAINEATQSDGNRYRLETNPITQKTRLVILRERGAPDTGLGTFERLLRDASRGLPPIVPRNDDGSTGDVYSFVARNAALVLRFDDLLDDDQEALVDLPETVRVLAGYPPETPFPARLVFDPNHGDVVNDEFHSTRVLIDLTITENERTTMAVPQPVNAVGLPESLTTTPDPNVSVRIPTVTDFGSGQFRLLRGLSGVPLASRENGPSDSGSPTWDIVRAMRAGNRTDRNNGFMLDLNAPEVVGGWNLRVDSAVPDPQGQQGFAFLLDMTFPTVCRIAPGPGDVIALGETFLEVIEQHTTPDVDGEVQDVRVRTLADQPVAPGVALVGNATFLSTFQSADPVARGCWVSFSPQPDTLPVTGVAPEAKVLMRFSEPMDPRSLSQFDNFILVFGDSNTVVNPTNLAVGTITASTDLKEFTFQPTLPLRHGAGASEVYHVRIDGPTDLAGNDLVEVLPPLNFTMSEDAPVVQNGSRVMRFNEIDELDPIGLTDLRGQFFYDFTAGVIRPRPVVYTSYPVDRTNPVPSIMIAFPRGVATPLSPLGSKLHAVWRYCDIGWQVLDETKYNLDVFGLSWTPAGGTVLNDFYDTFEIRLAHSRKLPDEAIDQNLLPIYNNSGLIGTNEEFEDNILQDPLSPQKVVHPRTLGYQIKGSDLFLSGSGRNMMPYPLNRVPNTPIITYTWRDTAVLARGGASSAGIPLDVEAGGPLNIEDDKEYVARRGQVPSFGLPLLTEIRCFPSELGIGLNSVEILLAINSSPQPNFRSYSTGGFNLQGATVIKNPDQQLRASGGFNPLSSPNAGQVTPGGDNALYIGQLDAVTRVSRVHTVWIDTNVAGPDFIEPIVLPPVNLQPSGTQVILEYRGAHDFVLADIDPLIDERNVFPFDSRRLNAYGDLFVRLDNEDPPDLPLWHFNLGTPEFDGEVQYVGGIDTWSDDIDTIDGGQYVQMRFTFLSNIETLLSPELSAVGIAYSVN